MKSGKYFKCPQPILDYHKRGLEKWGKGKIVTYPVSYRYNGGTIIDGEWYDGFEVPPPIVPEGFCLINIGIGLQLNAHPPYASMLMQPK